MPNISIVVTAKNAEKYLNDTLESINNSEGIDSIELVFVDDGSTDKTQEIIKAFNFKPFISLKYKYVELGRSKALNYGLSISSSDIVSILDADDLFHKDKLKIQYDYFTKNEDVLILATNYISGSSPSADFCNSIKNDFTINEVTIKDLIKSNSICHSSVMFDKSYIKYSEKRKMQIDLDMWFRFLSNHRAIYCINAPLVFKRLHANQSFESRKRLKYVISSYILTISYAKPFRRNLLEIAYRTAKLLFHLLPRKISELLK